MVIASVGVVGMVGAGVAVCVGVIKIQGVDGAGRAVRVECRGAASESRVAEAVIVGMNVSAGEVVAAGRADVAMAVERVDRMRLRLL